MSRYPLLLDLAGRDVLVVGGGPVAARRAAGVLTAGARVHVIAPSVCEELAELAGSGALTWTAREASAADVTAGPRALVEAAPLVEPVETSTPLLEPVTPVEPVETRDGSGPRWWLVHTATGAPDVDAAIAAAADDLGIWCVRADDAEASAGHVPAVALGPDGVQVAVSGGGDPGRARAIRDAISDLLSSGSLPLRRRRHRRPGSPASADSSKLGELFEVRPASRPNAEESATRETREPPARETREPAASAVREPAAPGIVVLVGGGPGDPSLLTVAGRQWLARADVVVTDRLAPTAVLDELDADVEIIDVGKTAGNHPIPQHEINRILVERAERGLTVVRLKGGDPFVLGRGGEEALHCLEHGVAVEVVPGVTSAISVAAAAGIPVTHRGITTSFVVASAHAGAGDAQQAAATAPPDATLVLLMGLSALADTAAELVVAGRPASTPVAVVSRGWAPDQRTIQGTLATIAAEVSAAELPGPAIVVVGEVVRLREQLGALDRGAQ